MKTRLRVEIVVEHDGDPMDVNLMHAAVEHTIAGETVLFSPGESGVIDEVREIETLETVA